MSILWPFGRTSVAREQTNIWAGSRAALHFDKSNTQIKISENVELHRATIVIVFGTALVPILSVHWKPNTTPETCKKNNPGRGKLSNKSAVSSKDINNITVATFPLYLPH